MASLKNNRPSTGGRATQNYRSSSVLPRIMTIMQVLVGNFNHKHFQENQ